MLAFIENRIFTANVQTYFPDDESHRLMQNALMENPERGDRIQGTGGLRKRRWSDPRRGKGTRGGIRVIYLYVPERQTIAFFQAYSKDKQTDLTVEQKKRYAALVEIIRQEILEL